MMKNNWNFQMLSDDFLLVSPDTFMCLACWLRSWRTLKLKRKMRKRIYNQMARWVPAESLSYLESISICGKAIIKHQCDAKCYGQQLLFRCNDKSKSQVPIADKGVADASIDAASEEEEENALEDDMVDAEKAQQLRVEGNEHFKA